MRSLLSARLHIIEKDGSRRKPRAGSNDSGLRDLDRKYRAWKFRRALLRWLAPIAIVAAAGSALFYAKLEASGWRAGELISHIAAYSNCDATQLAAESRDTTQGTTATMTALPARSGRGGSRNSTPAGAEDENRNAPSEYAARDCAPKDSHVSLFVGTPEGFRCTDDRPIFSFQHRLEASNLNG